MKKITLTAAIIAASLLLTIPLQASEKSKGKYCNSYEQTSRSISKKSKNLVHNLWKLNLTPTQTQQLLDILTKYSYDQQQISDTFSQDSFDKEKFAQIMKQKKEAEIIRQANIISEFYEVLTIEQREVFITNLNKKSKKQYRTKGEQGDKGCNGRG